MLRAATELDADATVVSLDGRCAYDTVSRAAFLSKLREVAPSLVPYVRAWYGGISTYVWWDADGQRHDVLQGEGCEQGDALAPALFALAQHDALHEAQGAPGGRVFGSVFGRPLPRHDPASRPSRPRRRHTNRRGARRSVGQPGQDARVPRGRRPSPARHRRAWPRRVVRHSGPCEPRLCRARRPHRQHCIRAAPLGGAAAG